nr:alpha-amylase family glycosyl hydrolase [Synechococcus sp. RedBA-s]
MYEQDHHWLLSQKWAGVTLSTNGFANGLVDLTSKISYIQELRANIVHIMPIQKCPVGKSDGGYAISNFREIDSRAGSLDDIQHISEQFRKNGFCWFWISY